MQVLKKDIDIYIYTCILNILVFLDVFRFMDTWQFFVTFLGWLSGPSKA